MLTSELRVARNIIARRFSSEKYDRHDMVISFKNHGLTQDEIADESLSQLSVEFTMSLTQC